MHTNLNFGNSILEKCELVEDNTTREMVEWRGTGNANGFKFHSLPRVVQGDPFNSLVVNMKIPSFFDYFDNKHNGLFLFREDYNLNLKNLRKTIKTIGKYGCPPALDMAPAPQFFTFANNYFHPFVLNNFTVGYFVCEETLHKQWEVKFGKKWRQVSINQPIAYDPMLGLFITRDAELLK